MKKTVFFVFICLTILIASLCLVGCKGEKNKEQVVIFNDGVLVLQSEDGAVVAELKASDISSSKSFDISYSYKNVYTWVATIDGSDGVKVVEDGKLIDVDKLLDIVKDGERHILTIYPQSFYTKLTLNGVVYKAVKGSVPQAITAIPQKDYRVFKGFSINVDGNDLVVTDENGKFLTEWQYDVNEMSLSPVYDLAPINLTLDYGHDRSPDSDVPEIVSIGQEMSFLRILGLEGHSFLGWYNDSNAKIVDEKGSFVYGSILTDENAALYGVVKSSEGYVLDVKANWQTLKYKVYLFYDNEQVSAVDVLYGAVIAEAFDLSAVNIGESYCELSWEGYDLLKTMPSVSIRLDVKDVYYHTDARGERIWECQSGVCVRCNKEIPSYVNHTLNSVAPCSVKNCVVCGATFLPTEEHTYPVSTANLNCVDKVCEVCGFVKEKTAEHVLDEEGLPECRCVNCGKNLINEIGYYRQGSKIYYGYYPATLLSVDSDADTLNRLEDVRPTFDDDNGWIPFDYGETDEFSNVWYKDVVLDSEKYRGIYIDNGYRENNVYQRSNGYSLCNTYWFKYEAISWTVIDEVDGKATLLCDKILDAGNYIDAQLILLTLGEVAFDGNLNECFEYATLPSRQIEAPISDYAKAMGIKVDGAELLLEDEEKEENHLGILPVVKMKLFPGRNVFTIKTDAGVKYFYYRVGTSGEFEISSTSVSFPVNEKDYVYYKAVADYGYSTDAEMRNVYVRDNKNYTLTLSPVPDEVTVNLVGDDAEEYERVKATFDSALQIIDLPEKDYFHFLGYYYDDVKVIDESGKLVDKANGFSEKGVLKKGENFVLSAKWDLNIYVLNFDTANGVGKVDPLAFAYASEKELPSFIVEKEGYRLTGWSASGSDVVFEVGAAFNGGEMIDALGLSKYSNDEYTLRACWTPNEYVVRFDKNGGNGAQMADEDFVYDFEKSLPSNTYTKTGYLFDGWNDGNKVWHSGEKVKNLTSAHSAVITLFAEWKPIGYQIVFDGGIGEVYMEELPCAYDKKATLPKNAFVKEGYRFVYWRYGDRTFADESTVSNLSSVADSVLTFTAEWRPVEYSIIYDPAFDNCETTMQNTSAIYDRVETLRNVSFARIGYEFLGWSESKGGEVKYKDSQTVENLSVVDGDEVTLYAVWKNNDYTVVYHSNTDDERTFSSSHVYDVLSALADNRYAKEGYYFVGWDDNRFAKAGKYEEGEMVSDLSSVEGGTVDLFAIWAPISYTVVYYPRGGYGETPSSIHYYDKVQQLSACKFERAGYTFVGWSEDPNATKATYTDKQTVNNLRNNERDVANLYAVWSANDYAVVYNANGGEGQMANTPAKVDASFALRSNSFTKVGHTFLGWNTDPNAEEALYVNEEIVSNLSLEPSTTIYLYAIWQGNEYRVYYSAGGGALPDGQTMDYSTFTYGKRGILRSNVFYKTGYSFDRWVLGNNAYGDGSSVLNLSTGADVTLTATWAANTYTVNFMPNGGAGEKVTAETFLYDEEKALSLCSYYKLGYSFGGWSLSANSEAVYEDGQEVRSLTDKQNGAINFYAVWIANSYTVRYNPNSGTGSTPSTPYAYDEEKALSICGYEKEGYTFIGWALSENGNVVYGNGEKVSNLTAVDNATIDLYATWKNNEYFFEYYANGGIGETYSQTFNYDVKGYVSACDFSRTGYHFVGWGESPNSTVAEYFAGDEVFNLTSADGEVYKYYAIWDNNVYTVVYNPNGGVGESYSSEQTYDVSFTLPKEVFTKNGYRIIGWDEDPTVYDPTNAVDTYVSNLTSVNKGIVNLYAIWESALTYTLLKNDVYAVTGIGDYLSYCNEVLIVPEKHKGKPVIEIKSGAFKNCVSLKEIFVPDSVVKIGKGAFSGCSSLLSIDLPFVGAEKDIIYESSSTVFGYIFGSEYYYGGLGVSQKYWGGDGSFLSGVYSFATYYIPSSLYKVTIRGGSLLFGAFYECKGIAFVSLENISRVGSYAFYGCTSLTSITLSTNLTEISNDAFVACYNLVEIFNRSSLDIVAGESTNGEIALFAKNVYGSDGESRLFIDENGYITYEDDEGISLIRYVGNDSILTLPSNIVKINDYAFYECNDIVSIILPDTITIIGNYSFSYCYKLISISIPAKTTSIGYDAFYGCYRLVEVENMSSLNIVKGESGQGYVAYYAKKVYQGSGESLLLYDGEYVFYSENQEKSLIVYLGSDQELMLPDGTTAINEYAFYREIGIARITLPDSVKDIGSHSFDSCSSLLEVTLPIGLTSIGESAFANCSSLISARIPQNVTEISAGVFANCSNMTEVIMHDRITTIGVHAFECCSRLTTVVLPSDLVDISSDAFLKCYKLIEVYNRSSLTIIAGDTDFGRVGQYAKNVFTTEADRRVFVDDNGFVIYSFDQEFILLDYIGEDASLVLPNGLTEIYKYAFYNNDKIESVTIPSGVRKIDLGAFLGCSSLEKTIFSGTLLEWFDIEFEVGWELTGSFLNSNVVWQYSNPIYYSHNLYIDGRNALTGILAIPYGVTSIAGSLMGANEIVSLILPSSVESIGEYAFYGCTSLTSVDFSLAKNLQEVGNYAFSACPALVSVVIPKSVNSIGRESFAYDLSLSSVLFEGECDVYDYAFRDCKALIEISVDGYVSDNAFYGCSGLVFATISGTIGKEAFKGCISLEEISFHAHNVTSIGFGGYDEKSVLGYCFGTSAYEGAAKVYQAPTGIYLGSRDFYIPMTLRCVTVVGGSIYPKMFMNCSMLESIVIGKDVTFVSSSAFDGINLKSISVEAGNPNYRVEDNKLIDISSNSVIFEF